MASLERRVTVEAARAAGHLLRRARDGERRTSFKGAPTHLVTEMDARAEQLITEHLRAAFPGDAILGEEGGALRASPGTFSVCPTRSSGSRTSGRWSRRCGSTRS